MKPQSVMKMACFTRKFSRYKNPIAYRLIRNITKRIYPKDRPHEPLRTVINFDQGLINVDTSLFDEYNILFFDYCEPAISSIIKRIVKPGDLCLDIGANIGGITLVLAFATGPEGRVFALEPHPRMVERLRANVELNQLENVSIMPVALSDSVGNATLYSAEDGHFHQGLSSLEPSENTPVEISVNQINGKILQEEIGDHSCKFIKIDVEGHDFVVLKELHGIINKYHPYLVFEYHRKTWQEHHSDIQQALEFLFNFDYRIYYIKSDMIFPYESQIPDSCDLFCSPKEEFY